MGGLRVKSLALQVDGAGVQTADRETRAPGRATEPLSCLRSAALCCSVCKDRALRCHTCVAASEEECDRQGSFVCPQYSDACSTITGPNTVMKSCSYKSFCDRDHHDNPGVKMACCFTEDCNGPRAAHSHGGPPNSAPALAPSACPALLGALITLLATSRL